MAGPVTVEINKRLLVECGGFFFLVSAVVDCQPSGSQFDVPLDLDFRVGEELDDEDKGAEGRIGLEDYLARLRDTFKVSRPLINHNHRSYFNGGIGRACAPRILLVTSKPLYLFAYPTGASPRARR